MLDLSSSAIKLPAFRIASEGVALPATLARTSVRERAINNAAGTPFPETSAITSPHLSLEIGMKS